MLEVLKRAISFSVSELISIAVYQHVYVTVKRVVFDGCIKNTLDQPRYSKHNHSACTDNQTIGHHRVNTTTQQNNRIHTCTDNRQETRYNAIAGKVGTMYHPIALRPFLARLSAIARQCERVCTHARVCVYGCAL